MAKKNKKKKEIEIKQGSPITREEWLETVIALTKRAIDDSENGMMEQEVKYSKELKELRKT